MLLTARQVQLVRLASRDYTLKDGRGLFLFVPADDPKCWHFRHSFAGKPVHLLRHLAGALRSGRPRTHLNGPHATSHGTDPGRHRRTVKRLSNETGEKLFRSAAERWYKQKEVAGRASVAPFHKPRMYRLAEIGLTALANRCGQCSRFGSSWSERSTLTSAEPLRPMSS